MGKKKKEAQNSAPEAQAGFVQGASGSFVPALDDPTGKYDVNTTAEKVYKRDWLIRIVAVVLGVLILLLGIGYACTAVMNSAGRFTVSLQGNIYGLQLSDNPEFDDPSLELFGSAIESMDNITESWILNPNHTRFEKDAVYSKFEDIDLVYGDHNGTNYLAYTFLIRNAGEEAHGENVTVDYRASLEIVSAYKGAEQALRAKVFVNGKETTYAAPKKGTDELEAFAADENFLTEDVIMQNHRSNFKVGDVDRYTVVVWLEGEDPECVNDIMGGEVKLKMNLEVLGESAQSGS